MDEKQVFASKTHRESRVKFLTSAIKKKEAGATTPGASLYTGFFTSDQTDEVGDIIERQATEEATDKYRKWGNIRYMHQPKAIGTVRGIGVGDGMDWNEVEFEVTHADVARDIDAGVLKALSVGIIVNEWDWIEDEEGEDDAKSQFFWWPMRITSYDLVEISVVDHPANYDAFIQADGDDGKTLVRKVLFEYDPENEFDMALGKCQMDNNFKTIIKGDPGERKMYVRKIATGEVSIVDEQEGMLSLSQEEAQKEWEILEAADAKDLVFAVAEYAENADGEGLSPDRHLMHHDPSVGDHNHANVDLSLFRMALTQVDDIEPVTKTVSAETLRSKAREHLDNHSAALSKYFDSPIREDLMLDEAVWGQFIESGKDLTWKSWTEMTKALAELADELEPEGETIEASTGEDVEVVEEEKESEGEAEKVVEPDLEVEESEDKVLAGIDEIKGAILDLTSVIKEAFAPAEDVVETDEEEVVEPSEEKVAGDEPVVEAEEEEPVAEEKEEPVDVVKTAPEGDAIEILLDIVGRLEAVEASQKDLEESLEKAKKPQERKAQLEQDDSELESTDPKIRLQGKTREQMRGVLGEALDRDRSLRG